MATLKIGEKTNLISKKAKIPASRNSSTILEVGLKKTARFYGKRRNWQH